MESCHAVFVLNFTGVTRTISTSVTTCPPPSQDIHVFNLFRDIRTWQEKFHEESRIGTSVVKYRENHDQRHVQRDSLKHCTYGRLFILPNCMF